MGHTPLPSIPLSPKSSNTEYANDTEWINGRIYIIIIINKPFVCADLRLNYQVICLLDSPSQPWSRNVWLLGSAGAAIYIYMYILRGYNLLAKWRGRCIVHVRTKLFSCSRNLSPCLHGTESPLHHSVVLWATCEFQLNLQMQMLLRIKTLIYRQRWWWWWCAATQIMCIRTLCSMACTHSAWISISFFAPHSQWWVGRSVSLSVHYTIWSFFECLSVNGMWAHIQTN